jgi:hypothetical protein
MIKCTDSGPARNHFFITLVEGREMMKDPTFRSAGFASVCDRSIRTYQIKEGNRTGPSYRYYPK